MKIYGYEDEGLEPDQVEPSELLEITLVASADELRKIAKFLQASAEGMERKQTEWEHEHLSDAFPEFKTSPHFVVCNPKP